MRSMLLAVAALCGLAFVLTATAADPPPKAKTNTVITCGEMCDGCAKKIEKKLKPMEGIADLRFDTKAKTVTVVPKPKAKLSPLTLWTAMEEIGKTPKKLVGPGGTFTKKPKS
ncbi:MAG TPA: heavy metal-associated domain-containing protein [Planctomycetaceae bacterium]